MFFDRATTATRPCQPEADRPGKGGGEMSEDIALVLAITLMIAVIRGLT
jgi:hypothetical protein